MPKRRRSLDPSQQLITSYTKKRRVFRAPSISTAMPIKRVVTTTIAKRRPSYRRRAFSRRRTTYKTRRPRRRFKRAANKPKGFAGKVLAATSSLDSVIKHDTGSVNGQVGRNIIHWPEAVLSNALHLAIQGQINIAEDNPSPSALHDYWLQQASSEIRYLNASAAKVHVEIYYYKARRDTTLSAEDSYDNGFAEHSAYSSTSTRATPFMSPDFVTNFQIIRVQRRSLEQGQHVAVRLRYGPMKLKSDIFNKIIHVRGTYGVAVKFVGDLGVNNAGPITTTAPNILYERLQKATYRRMTDSIPTMVRIGDEIATGNQFDMRFANADTGTAVQGTPAMNI